MQRYFGKQQELQELTLEFLEETHKKTDMELVNLRRISCGATPPPLKKRRLNEDNNGKDDDDDKDDLKVE